MEENKPHISQIRNQIDELTKQFKFIEVDPSKKQQYVIANFELLLKRLLPDGHLLEWRETRSSCL